MLLTTIQALACLGGLFASDATSAKRPFLGVERHVPVGHFGGLAIPETERPMNSGNDKETRVHARVMLEKAYMLCTIKTLKEKHISMAQCLYHRFEEGLAKPWLRVLPVVGWSQPNP